MNNKENVVLIKTEALKSMIPHPLYNSWGVMIKMSEIMKCIEDDLGEYVETPLGDTSEEARQNHIKKIAYFVKNGYEDPISLDVGIPEIGYRPDNLVDDGNHRLVASYIRKDVSVPCVLSGSEAAADELFLDCLWDRLAFG